MITEIALIHVRAGSAADFEAAVARAAPLFRAAPGCLAMSLERTIENPDLYRLVVKWERIEDHTVRFRASEAFQGWRALTGRYFSQAPEVSHVAEVQRYFGV